MPGTSAQPTATESVPEDTDPIETEPVRDSLDEALGAQAVQDFAVIIDMRRHDGADSTSFYDEVLAVAESSAGPPAELTAGFSFAAVEGLDATAVDEDGNPLESISIDHGLLRVDAAAMDYPLAVADYLADQTGSGAAAGEPIRAVLVEIATADYLRARTHVQAGDRSRVDITFVESVAPGDQLEVVHLFGQTYPGEATSEQGLAPHELFVQRWREGRIRFLGGPFGPFVHADQTVEAVEGSTVLTRDQKLAVLRAREQVAAAGDVLVCSTSGCREANPSEFIEQPGEDPGLARPRDEFEVLLVEGTDAIYANFEHIPGAGYEVEVCIEGGCSQHAVIDYDSVPLLIRNIRAWIACTASAGDMNRANNPGGGGYQDSGLTPFERFVAGLPIEAPTTTAPSSTSTTAPPQPEGGMPDVGCDVPQEQREEPPPPQSGFIDQGDIALAYGDIHIVTFDGTYYANQAAGEFILLESPVIQIRTEPFADRRSVSMATAVAADLDGRRVSVHLSGETWVDGVRIDPVRGEVMPVGRGELLWWGDGWVLRWPDGTLVRVDRNEFSLAVVVEAAAEPRGGMFGDRDGDPENDLVTRSGQQLDADADEDFERFYAEYIDSWRITGDESLFHYAAGESTEKFTIEGFPAEPVTADSLPFEIAETAETQCRLLGVRDGRPLEACIVDVGATGEIAFAEDALLAQAVAQVADRTAPTSDPSGGTETNVLRIGAVTIAFGPTPPVVAPNSPAPSWECQVDGGSMIAVGSFREAADRAYKITIRYFDADTGVNGEELTIRVDRNNEPYAWVNPAEHFADAVESISLDGTTLTASGALYVNDPPVIGLGPINALPEGTELEPFELVASCEP